MTLPPAHVFTDLRPRTKPALLAELARRAGEALGLDAAGIAAALLAREALGTTGFGGGLAIPHARLAELAAPAGFLARLPRPLDYAAIDGRPVDIVFLLLSPAGHDQAHLANLAAISRRLRDAQAAAALRAATGAGALRQAFQGDGK